MDNDLVD